MHLQWKIPIKSIRNLLGKKKNIYIHTLTLRNFEFRFKGMIICFRSSRDIKLAPK